MLCLKALVQPLCVGSHARGKKSFASEEASKIALDLCFKIADELEKKKKR
jgi:hypothetical protein